MFRALAISLICLTGAASANALEPRSGVLLRALDKLTGNSTDIEVQVGQRLDFGRLEIVVQACFEAPPEDTPESAAYLEVFTTTPEERERLPGGQLEVSETGSPAREDGRIFSGWMFASSPGLNAIDHPTYDVWVISCNAS